MCLKIVVDMWEVYYVHACMDFPEGVGRLTARVMATIRKVVVWVSVTWKDFSEVMVPELSWEFWIGAGGLICSWRLDIKSTGVLVGNCVGAMGQDVPLGMVPRSKLGM